MSLPSGYKRLAYIESSGTQCINTEIIPNSKTSAVIDVVSLAVTGYSILGYYNSSNDCFRIFNASNALYLDYGKTGSNRLQGASGSFTANVRKRLEFGNLYVKDADTGATLLSGTAVSLEAKTTPLYINGNNNYSKNRWYACKIYDNGVLVRDYVPCLNPSGEAGLYDLANGKFYGNAGTGTFAAGPVASADTPENFEQVLAIFLRWSSVDCEGYNIYRDGVLLGTTTDTHYIDLTADENEQYTYTLTAYRGSAESDPATLEVYTRSGYFVLKPVIENAFFQ